MRRFALLGFLMRPDPNKPPDRPPLMRGVRPTEVIVDEYAEMVRRGEGDVDLMVAHPERIRPFDD